MNKKKAILVIIATVLVIGLAGFTTLVGFGSRHTGSAKNIKLGLDLQGGVSITYQVEQEDFSDTDFEDTIYKLQKRVQNFSTEAQVYKEGDNRITVDVPGETSADTVLKDLGKPGSLYFAQSVTDDQAKELKEDQIVEVDGSKYRIWLSGTDVKTANATSQTDSTTSVNKPVVDLTFTDDGATKFEEATTACIGSYLYIIYDDKIISNPTVSSTISGGTAQITYNANASLEDAQNLASNIRIGSLKLTLNEISHKVVTAQLGADALKNSLIAGLIGLIIVILFMCFVYRIPGIISAIALVLYVGMIVLTLNGFNLTLSLSGVAGIILSIGMAVDANVIIYARIREEIAKGRSVDTAIKAGFSKATSAIVDGNITTVIAGLVLMWRGSGTVQGFAQTLIIGILLSMFTALVVTRLLVYAFYALGATKPGLYGKERDRRVMDFIGKRKLFFSISGILILVGVVSMIFQGATGNGAFNYSIEFQGGKAYTLEFDKEYTVEDFNDNIKPAIAKVIGSNDIQGQKEIGSNKFTIKMPDVDETKITEMKSMLVKDYGAKEDSFDESYISGTVSNEMARNAVIATILATICMLIYIWFRFKDVRFAGAAVLALVHDVLVVVGFYALTRTSVGNTFIACMLTLVGYSINATIVIFDRIRENLKLAGPKPDLKEIVNSSVTQTLTRSIYTSFTTFVMILMIYILGVASIKEFALPLMAGIICGGYSSVCITGALWYSFKIHQKTN